MVQKGECYNVPFRVIKNVFTLPKKCKMKCLLSILLSFISFSIFAQNESSLTVEYNLYENSVVYKRLGKEVVKPDVKAGDNIYVVITEFNPYIMRAELEVQNTNYAQASSELGYEDIGETGGGGPLSGITGLLGGLSMGSNIQQSFGGIPSSRGVSSEDIMESKNEFAKLTEQLTAIESKMNASFQKLQLYKTTEQSQQLALEDIEQLKTNAFLRPSRIKELIEEEINYSFAKRKGEEINIDDLVNEMKKKDDLEKTIEEYNQSSEEYIKIADKWKKFSASVFLINEQIEDMQMEFIKSAADSINTSLTRNVELKLNKPLNIDLNTDFDKENINKMAALRQVYEEVQGNIFTYSFPPVQAKGDEVVFDLIVRKKNDINEYKEFKKLNQTIPVSGGWKISAGLGLGFGVLKDKSYEYSVVNSKITADQLDDFVPLLVSFAHAYKKTTNNLNFGGSFGIGFPIQGGTSVQSMTFFLGPTMILGKNQKFLLTAGLMGGKVNRLSDGFEVGDSFDNATSTVPTIKRYELGYFIGISYDLMR
jgi:hypothetical protein